MIFITLGSQKFQFNRLLIAVDNIIADGKINDEIFAQTGYSDYIPKNFRYKKFLSREEFSETIGKSDMVITHGGTGAIINAVKQGKKVIAVPRLARFNEHVDDHQFQIVKQFEELNIIESCYKVEDIGKLIQIVRNKTYDCYVSNTERIINSIEEYISENVK